MAYSQVDIVVDTCTIIIIVIFLYQGYITLWRKQHCVSAYGLRFSVTPCELSLAGFCACV